MAEPIRAALERLVELETRYAAQGANVGMTEWDNAIAAARAALETAPEGQGPSDQEIADVFSRGCRDLSRSYEPPFLGGARAVLARWGRPAAPPAPAEGEVGEVLSEDVPAPVPVPVPGGELVEGLRVAIPREKYDEDFGPVTWWRFPVVIGLYHDHGRQDESERGPDDS